MYNRAFIWVITQHFISKDSLMSTETCILSAEIDNVRFDQVKFLSDYSGIKSKKEIHVRHKEVIIINRSAKI